MSASGSTPHLHLSQYTDTDHPSYVSDYTEDMGRIDTGFNLAQTNALNALNRVAALEQSIGSSGAVGQTATFSKNTTVDGGVSGGNQLILGLEGPRTVMTRNAEPADVPWTWQPNGDMVGLRFTDRGVYRITVEAQAVYYSSSMDVSCAFIGLGELHIAPFARISNAMGMWESTGSFVIPYDGGGRGMDLMFASSFNGQTVPKGKVVCQLTVDVERLSTEYSDQPSPGQPE